MKNSSVDIIVTTRNRIGFLKRTLDSFFATVDLKMIGKVFISDDFSNDGTLDYLGELERNCLNLEIIKANEHRGLVLSFNDAFQRAHGEFICEFQDDIIFKQDWLEKELRIFAKYEQEGIDFITGFDAPEHHVNIFLEKFKIKPSSRFTQLLARRATWSRWFPMKPDFNFPTPSKRNGKRIGSNIDCNIYQSRKNSWGSNVKFLVIPGLIEHLAEEKNSTWRK